MVYLLFIVMVILWIASLYLNKKDYSSPAIAFITGFLFQSLWVLLYCKKWSLGLHLNTFLTISLGGLEFIFVTELIKRILKNKKVKQEKSRDNLIKIDTVIETLYLIFTILGSILYVICIVNAVGGSFSSIKAISEAIAKYDSLAKFTDQFEIIKIPFLINNIRFAIVASSYWFLYVIINNYVFSKKVKIIELAIFVIALIASTLDGARSNAMTIIISGIIYFFIIYTKKGNIISTKHIAIIGSICVVSLATFIMFATVLGRNITENTMDYLSIYCGAEVKNLDTYLQEKNVKSNKIWGSQTFISLITSYGEKIGFKGYKKYNLDLPFREVNGISLGNVYTTYYPYIYDFGYLGTVILVMIMSAFSQLIYEYIKKINLKDKPSIITLCYGIIFSCLLFSFFSNKFYENVFSMNFIKEIIIWYLLNYFFCQFKFKKKK